MAAESEMDKRRVVFEKYEIGKLLGRGTFAKVFHGKELATGESVAVKIINKEQVRKEAMIDQIQREIAVMRLVRHRNVVEIREVMATKTKIFVVMEYVRGGELFAKVAKGRLSEDHAKKYFQQLISAVDFCHSRGVSHRDLKPENLLLDHNGDLKVSDFGLSALPEQLQHDGLLHTQCGTPAYVAPEVLRKRGYDGAKADIWSCGVILYVLLAGFLPFRAENLMKMYRKIYKAEFDFPGWFSGESRRLIGKLLVPDPDRRISIQGIMRVPWFSKGFSRSLSFGGFDSGENDDDGGGDDEGGKAVKTAASVPPKFFNAFELISAMSPGFDLSNLFDNDKKRSRSVFMSRWSAAAVMERIEAAAERLRFKVVRLGDFRVRLQGRFEGRKGKLAVTAEVFEAAPEISVVEFAKSAGDTLEYVRFCEDDVRPALKDIVWAWQGDSSEINPNGKNNNNCNSESQRF